MTFRESQAIQLMEKQDWTYDKDKQIFTRGVQELTMEFVLDNLAPKEHTPPAIRL